MKTDFAALGAAARAAAFVLAAAATPLKNRALREIANSIERASQDLLIANDRDVQRGRSEGVSEALLDRLRLSEERIAAIVASIHQVVALPDPVGEVQSSWSLPSGV